MPDDERRTRLRQDDAIAKWGVILSPWILLISAGILEVCWVIGLKFTDGFTKAIPSIFTLITLVGSILLLEKASQSINIGIAYSIWVGIGVIGTSLLSILLFKEPSTITKIFFLILLVISIFGLKITINNGN